MIYGRKGEEKDGVLKVISRDLEDAKIVLSMVDGHLEFLGKGEVYEMDSEQNRIIKVLEEEARPMDIPAIIKALGIAGDAHYKRFRVVIGCIARIALDGPSAECIASMGMIEKKACRSE